MLGSGGVTRGGVLGQEAACALICSTENAPKATEITGAVRPAPRQAAAHEGRGGWMDGWVNG